MNQKKILCAAVLLAACAALAYAGYHVRLFFSQEEKEEIRVVILDSGDYYHSDAGIENGIQMALDENLKEKKIPLIVEVMDDGGDYVKGISMAKSLAEDDSVDMVLSFQNFEAIGPEAGFFEKAQKPFLVTMGCYDEVADHGYHYLLTDFLSAKAIGARIGRYIRTRKDGNIALCHSDTTFEKDEIRGLQSALEDSADSQIYYAQTGPFTEVQLASTLQQCRKLGINVLVANFYDQEDSAWLLSRMRQEAPDIAMIGDYALDSSEILDKYGEDLEGVMIVPSYPYKESDKMASFVQRYEKRTGANFSTAAVQYYDLFSMLGSCYGDTEPTGRQWIGRLRSEEGYDGMAGRIRFDENGRLAVEECPMYICDDKEFIRMEDQKE